MHHILKSKCLYYTNQKRTTTAIKITCQSIPFGQWGDANETTSKRIPHKRFPRLSVVLVEQVRFVKNPCAPPPRSDHSTRGEMIGLIKLNMQRDASAVASNIQN